VYSGYSDETGEVRDEEKRKKRSKRLLTGISLVCDLDELLEFDLIGDVEVS